MKNLIIVLAMLAVSTNSYFAQDTNLKESIETEFSQPLYLDLPGDLNVKKGYRELNFLGAYQSFEEFSYYRTSVEYSFSPIDNLGLEVEIPFNFYGMKHETEESENKIEAVRIGGMYSLPNLKIKDFSLSVGFYNDFEFSTFQHFGKPLFEGNAFNPFLGIAKVWDKKITALVYAGPNFRTIFEENHTLTDVRVNATIGYLFNDKNSFNIETNSIIYKGDLETYLRPQVKLYFQEHWNLGLGTTFPTNKGQKGIGGFLRLIYNP